MTANEIDHWQPVGIIDVMSRNRGKKEQCERCHRYLRYKHLLKNERGERIGVGKCCSRRLTLGYDPEAAEREARAFMRPRGWVPGRDNPNNITKILPVNGRRIRATVFEKFGMWAGAVAVGQDEPRYTDKFTTQGEAISAAYEIFQDVRKLLEVKR